MFRLMYKVPLSGWEGTKEDFLSKIFYITLWRSACLGLRFQVTITSYRASISDIIWLKWPYKLFDMITFLWYIVSLMMAPYKWTEMCCRETFKIKVFLCSMASPHTSVYIHHKVMSHLQKNYCIFPILFLGIKKKTSTTVVGQRVANMLRP